jgi:hypothetical protein
MASRSSSGPGPELGTCFGFQVRSSLPFAFLREGDGDPLEVSAPSESGAGRRDRLWIEWTPTRDGGFHGRLYRNESGFRLWVANLGWFLIEPEASRIVLPEADDAVIREQRLWGIPTLLCLLHRGDLPLHAAAVEVDGSAVVLAAPGTFGKTTLAAAFYRAGHRVLSEDVSCLRLSGAPVVIPGPATLRMRRDMVERLDLPATRLVSTGGDRHHLALLRDRGDCQPVPLRAIVLLRPSEDELKLERAPKAEALRDLWALSSRVSGAADRRRCFQWLSQLARSVPIWNLSRRLEIEALDSTVDRIAADV